MRIGRGRRPGHTSRLTAPRLEIDVVTNLMIHMRVCVSMRLHATIALEKMRPCSLHWAYAHWAIVNKALLIALGRENEAMHARFIGHMLVRSMLV
jgi:hypothetical protein